MADRLPPGEPTLIGDLLDQWEEAREQGIDLSPDELCANCPELLNDLKSQIAALVVVDQHLSSTVTDADTHASCDKTVSVRSNFQHLRLSARGGLGVVYSAEDQRLHRQVALKFLRHRLINDTLSRQQFAMEAEVTSRLEHPGIVPVYGIGETSDGRAFYAMRFIQGETMDEAIGRYHAMAPDDLHKPMAFRSLLGHFVSLCKTIAYAHNRGILHRDIKPANVMLGRYGETLVVDWGLAMPIGRDAPFKLKDEQTLLISGSSRVHSSSSQVGTPAYMSPEQTTGSENLRPASDIYSLGATLYKLLTGRVPYDAPTMPEMRQSIIRGEFTHPRKINAGIPRPLESICIKGMAPLPDSRYATALKLAEDVERYLADERVAAHRETFVATTGRWARRHRGIAFGGVLAMTMLFLGGLVLSAWMATVAQREQSAKLDAQSASLAAEKAFKEVSLAEARSIATALEFQIEQKLSVAEEAARDATLVAAVERAYAEPGNRELWKSVNERLGGIRERWLTRDGFKPVAWFVNLNDGKGTQIARAPFLDPATGAPVASIGKPLASRQYFRGGPAAPPANSASTGPITASLIAAPHRSTNDDLPKVTFTAPIFSQRQAQPIGVLGLAVEVYDLTSLDRYLLNRENDDSDHLVDAVFTVVYTRPDFFDEATQRDGGLVMQHPAFRSEADGGLGMRFQPTYVDEKTLGQIRKTRGATLIEDYHDPLGRLNPQFAGSWMAVVAPISLETFEGRDKSNASPGWAVVMQRRPTNQNSLQTK